MTSELNSEYEHVQLSGHSLANQLADTASMMSLEGLFPTTELSKKIADHVRLEDKFRLHLEQASRRSLLDLPENFFQVPFSELKVYIESISTLELGAKQLESLRSVLDQTVCDQTIKRNLYQELSSLDQLIRVPELPLSNEIQDFAIGQDSLTARINEIVIESKKVDSLPETAPKEIIQKGLETPVIEDETRLASPPPIIPDVTDLPESPTSAPQVQEKVEEQFEEISEVVASPEAPPSPEEESLIFDDLDSEKSEQTSGKQILTSAEISHQMEELSAELEARSEQEASSAQIPSTNSDTNRESSSQLSGSIFDELDDTEASGTSNSISNQNAAAVTPPSSPVTGFSERTPEAVPVFVSNTDYSHVKEYATKAVNSQNRFDRVSFLGRLTWELIALGEYSWAFQISRCLYANVDDDLVIPAPAPWLISLLTMGDHVRLSSGRIAREFNTIVEQHRDDALQISKTPDSPEAFLLRAALMRGTITTASPLASDILRSYSIESNQTQLYNYCARIASFATRASGLKLDQYFYRPGAASIESDARAIRSQVMTWRRRVFDQILPYQVVTPLFSRAHWSVQASQAVLEPELIDQWRARQLIQAKIAQLLLPIADNNLTQGVVVEQEIRALSHSVLLTDSGTQVIFSPTESVEVPGREIYNYVQEAIEFASHWLVLAASYPGMESVLVPQEVNELRDEIDHRQNTVFLELKQLDKTHGSQAHRSALTACRRSMDRITQLFHPTEEPRIAEIDHLCLLNSDLLKIPGITLDNDWQCHITPTTLEHQILTIMKHRFVSWEEAFELQLSAGCYRSAHHLLKLDHFSDAQKDRYRSQLEERRKENVDSLYELSQQIRSKIEESQTLEVVNSFEAEKLMRQLESIRERISSEYRLDQLRSDLMQFWQLLENRKDLELKKVQDRISKLTGQNQTPSAELPTDVPVVPSEENESSSDQEEEDDSEGWAIDV